MMEERYLVTYEKDNIPQFAWFETYEDMKVFLDEGQFQGIFEKLLIKDCKPIICDFEAKLP